MRPNDLKTHQLFLKNGTVDANLNFHIILSLS